MTPGTSLTDGAVVDSSAIMSILDKRLSAQAFREALEKTRPLFMGAPTYVELSVVVLGKKSAAGLKPLDELLAKFGVQIVAFDPAMAKHAQAGCSAFGKGHNPASLNMGDLYSYGLAMAKGLPLFFEGLDFSQTNVGDAMLMKGYRFDAQHLPQPLSPQIGS